MRVWVLLSCLLLTVGCARPARRLRPGTVNLLIDPQCQTKPAELEDCNTKTNPPKCKKAKITYKADCARIQVTEPQIGPKP